MSCLLGGGEEEEVEGERGEAANGERWMGHYLNILDFHFCNI